MKKSTKMLAVLSLSFTSMVTLVIAGIPSNNFAIAEKEDFSTEFISNLVKKLDSTSNETPKTITFTSSNGIDFSFETYRCSNDSNNLKIQKGGYIRNITAINGLLKIKNFACNDSSIASFVDCVADPDSSSFSPENAFKGDSTCKDYAFNGTNFILKSDGDLTVSSLEVCYSCLAGSNGFITSDNPNDIYSYNNECEYYGYGADGTSADTPFKISGEEAFVAFAKEVCTGNSYTGKYFKLDDDLNFVKDESLEFISVGNIDNPFDGHFDALNGNYNHSINVRDEAFEGFEKGIFGAISNNAVIENLDVVGTLDLGNGSGTIGGVAGYAEGGTIKNCNVSCDLTGNDISGLGGILGVTIGNTSVINCHVDSYIEIDAGCNVGGLIGSCDDTCFVKDSTFEGNLMVYGDSDQTYNCGGLIGEFMGIYPSTSIQNCSIVCDNIKELNIRVPELDAPYSGLLLGQYEDGFQHYVGCEVGYADNSDYPEVLLDPGCWNIYNAWYSVYCWDKNGADYWFKMEKDIASGYYVTKIDIDSYVGGIFVRMKSDSTEFGWDNKWNQSNDISFDGKNNLYSISDWGEEKSPGSWSFFDRYPEE